MTTILALSTRCLRAHMEPDVGCDMNSHGPVFALFRERTTMWIIESERRYVDLGTNKEGQQIGFWETRDIGKKEDGTTIFCTGGGREGRERFKYQDSEVELEFWADRFEHPGLKLTDTYHIWVHLPKGMSLNKARAVADNMREALLALPPQPVLHKGEPPKNVVLHWDYWNQTHPGSEVREDLP
jgi:hypothetical protein